MFRLLFLIFFNFHILTFAKFEENSTDGVVEHVQHHVQVDIRASDVSEKPVETDFIPEKPVETDVLPDAEVLKLIPWENNPGSHHRFKKESQSDGRR